MQNPPQSAQGQRNPYMVLGVKPTAEKDEMKSAYRELAKEHHPDRNPDSPITAAQKMKEVAEAWDLVSDAARRKEYDGLWLKMRVPKDVQAAPKKAAPAPPPSFFARLFGRGGKEGAGSQFHAYFTAAITCFQYPGGKLMAQAETELRRALTEKPDSWEARFDLALACYWQGKYTEALAMLKDVQRLFPNDPGLRRLVDALMPAD